MRVVPCSSCGERPAMPGHDLCSGCDEDALGEGVLTEVAVEDEEFVVERVRSWQAVFEGLYRAIFDKAQARAL